MKKAFIILLSLLTGCVSGFVSNQAPPDLYTLVAPDLTPWPEGARLPMTLLVERPTVSPALNTQRILWKRAEGRVGYYPFAAWASPLASLLESVLVRTFEKSGGFDRVIGDFQGMVPDIVLSCDFLAFNAVYTGDASAPTAQVHLQCQSIMLPYRTIISTLTLQKDVPAAQDNPEAVRAALQSALSEVLAQLVAKTTTDLANFLKQ